MRIMIFGDTASGKSSFAEKLGAIEDVPVLHLDQLMEEVGRDDRVSIGNCIVQEASKAEWIIEGNAFTKDPTYRMSRADVVYVFDFNRFATLYNHVKRYVKLRSKQEARKGSASTSLNLRYFVPYILIKFPSRKKQAIKQAKAQGKNLKIFTSHEDVNRFLAGKK